MNPAALICALLFHPIKPIPQVFETPIEIWYF